MSDLLPCPFCNAADGEVVTTDFSLYAVECNICGACGPTKPTAGEAIAAWNKRATGWQPIATAPRDGTEILGWDPTAEARVPIWFLDGEWAVCWSAEPNPNCTLWQPLPTPPEE